MENQKMKVNQILTRNQVISSIVWAVVILACAYNLESSNTKIMYILLAGFFVEFLRITSSNKAIKKEITHKDNGVKQSL
ncbi:MAG: hypothetical protein KJ578_12230 [Bacteroidetes bacterium]|nr:hypothetical protein [Bacteroidota bacterium]